MRENMKALVFDTELKLVNNLEKPQPKSGEALIKVSFVGICNTDSEIVKGYMGYKGILGHEFVGVVEQVADEKDCFLIGKRVLGEINLGCNNCDYCYRHLERHCPNRSTLGIWKKEGCFCEYLTLPVANLLEVPDCVKDEFAVFTEPLAAAVEIFEQIHIEPSHKVCVLGDGKLGLLCALVLNAYNVDVTLVGKHKNKLEIARKQGVETKLLQDIEIKKQFDVVVEATGNISGFETSLALVKPRGILVLKSTIASGKELNLAPIVIDEITVLGSRCGKFEPAIRLLRQNKIDLAPLISEILPFEDAILGFKKNAEKDTIKILLRL